MYNTKWHTHSWSLLPSYGGIKTSTTQLHRTHYMIVPVLLLNLYQLSNTTQIFTHSMQTPFWETDGAQMAPNVK